MNPAGGSDNQARLDRDVTAAWRHRVRFTRQAWDTDNPAMVDAFSFDEHDADSNALVVVDRGYLDARPTLQDDIERYFASHQARLPKLVGFRCVAGAETAKNDLSLLEGLLRDLHALQLDRRSYVVAIGGGAVLDMAGFAAAVTHRGVRLVRMPTTTLAQADSGVGVKNGVNMFGSKNFIGTFAVPHAVVNDLHALCSLPDPVWRDGLSEAVKVALLKDAAFFQHIEANSAALAARDETAAEPVWQRSAELHLNHITLAPPEGGGDPFEARTARPLDFGHWAAHRLEELSGFALAHGHAVALGLALDLHYAAAVGLCSDRLADRVTALLDRIKLPTAHPLLAHADLLTGIESFRQHLGGRLTITLLRDIAQSVDVHSVDEAVMQRCAHALAESEQSSTVFSGGS